MRKGAALGTVLLALLLAPAAARAQVNYPLEITLELRDANGNLVDAFNSVCPAEGVSVRSTGWLANSSVRATFHSDPVDLGAHAVNGSGVLDFSFKIANVQNGMHALRLEGTGATGLPRAVEASFLCECKQPAAPPLAVAGAALDAPGGVAGGGISAFGRTGAALGLWTVIALDLVAVGLVLRLAVRRRQRTTGSADTRAWRGERTSPPAGYSH